mgnify:CR=1 FL=1
MPFPAPRKLIVLGDSGVYGWGDPEEGGWCERLRRHWMGLPEAPVLYPLGVRGDGLELRRQRQMCIRDRTTVRAWGGRMGGRSWIRRVSCSVCSSCCGRPKRSLR